MKHTQRNGSCARFPRTPAPHLLALSLASALLFAETRAHAADDAPPPPSTEAATDAAQAATPPTPPPTDEGTLESRTATFGATEEAAQSGTFQLSAGTTEAQPAQPAAQPDPPEDAGAAVTADTPATPGAVSQRKGPKPPKNVYPRSTGLDEPAPARQPSFVPEGLQSPKPDDAPGAVGERPVVFEEAKQVLRKFLDLGAEYRVRSIYINPLDLASEDVQDTWWVEQRLRVNLALKVENIVAIVVQADILNGALFGDNGTFLQNPSPNFGVTIATRQPNLTAWDVGLPAGLEGTDAELDIEAYRPVLKSIDPIRFNWVYGDVYLPIGLLRVGRQPLAYGDNITGNDGGRYNRWGVSLHADSADRVLFGTKLDEAVKAIQHGPGYVADRSQDNGVFLGLFFDWLAQDLPYVPDDNLYQFGGALQWRIKDIGWLKDFNLSANVAHLMNKQFDTAIWGFPIRLDGTIYNFTLSYQHMFIYGHTREISEGFAALGTGTVTRQEIKARGERLILDYRIGPVTLTAEYDFASGDDDPRPETTLSVFSFARDTNVGLLLFKQVLAYQSARSVAVGIENLRDGNFTSFPITEAATQGRFQNAIAFFPQVKWDILKRRMHDLHLRVGALFAWPEARGVVDPIQTTLSLRGPDTLERDSVNFNGGRPGSYYGTELDAQVRWVFMQSFVFTIEGAYLFAGSSLQDANGDAANAGMVEARFEFLF